MIPIIYYDEVDSTQDLAWSMGKALGRELAIVAGAQRSGRGRCGRRWYSPPGGLYFSIYIQRRMPAEHACRLQYYAALAVYRALEKLGVKCRIGWPNDLFVDRGKVSGIIVENLVVEGYVINSVIGIGVKGVLPDETLISVGGDAGDVADADGIELAVANPAHDGAARNVEYIGQLGGTEKRVCVLLT